MLAANQAAVNTVQQLAKMHQRLEMQQLEKIRDICEAALEDMDSVPDKVFVLFSFSTQVVPFLPGPLRRPRGNGSKNGGSMSERLYGYGGSRVTPSPPYVFPPSSRALQTGRMRWQGCFLCGKVKGASTSNDAAKPRPTDDTHDETLFVFETRAQIRYMKPLLDDKFVAYMGYAIQTEREAIEKRGLNPDREPSRWLQVLGVIQKGVMAELQKSVHKDVEVIFGCVGVYFGFLCFAFLWSRCCVRGRVSRMPVGGRG